MPRLLPALSLAVLVVSACRSGAREPSLALSCGGVGTQFDLCRQGAEAWSRMTGYRTTLVSTPNSSTERLALYQQLLAAGAEDIDVFQVDVVWPGILAPHFVDLTPYVTREVLDQHFEPIVTNNTVDGRLVAMPWYTDVGLLYYRADLLAKHRLPVPTTWQELTDTAGAIQSAERAAGNSRLWGFVWQGRAYEGLTCNALEWIHSFGGGTLVEADGAVTISHPAAARALELAASWVGTISPTGVLNYAEEEARGVFQSGNAVFMRNWPYALHLVNGPDSPVRGNVAITALPVGEPRRRHSGTLGGWQLAVSRYSRHPELAVDLVLSLTSTEEQQRRAIEGALLPTIRALYGAPDVLAAQPFLGSLPPVLSGALARPSRVVGVKYNQFSSAVWSAVHATLSGAGTAQTNLMALERRLDHLSRGGRW